MNRRVLRGVAVLSVGASALAVAGVGTARAATPTTTATTAVGHVNPPALWLHLAGTPTQADIRFAADHYRVVILNPWETAALRGIKALNPAVTVLEYKDLSSTRSYATNPQGVDDASLPTGVGFGEAASHEDWFAHAADGTRVQWTPYPGHWQMAVWNAGYQDRWAANVVTEVTTAGWDGVMADNDLTAMGYYWGGKLEGGRTDTDLGAGERALVTKAGRALQATGKLLVPNITDGRLDATLWSSEAAWGGGLEEQFVHWGDTPGTGYIGDWGPTGWDGQAADLAATTLPLAVTHRGEGDSRTEQYGLASFWVTGGGKGAWTATTVDGYVGTPLLTEQTWDLGTPLTGIQRQGSARTRTFTDGFAAANPGTGTVTVAVPLGSIDAKGLPVTQVTLTAYTGVVLRSVVPAVVPLQHTIIQTAAVEAPAVEAPAAQAPDAAAPAAPAVALAGDAVPAAQLHFMVR